MSSLSGMRPGTGMWRMVLALVRQRRRLWLATFAVALSVGYLAGALTLLNRVSEGLADLSSAGAENADMVIEGDVAYESALEQTRRLIPSSIGQSLIGQPGIAAVIPRVEDVVMLLKTDGSPVVAPGLSEQPLGANWPADSKMSPYRFVGNGRAPEGPNEVAIDHRSAESAGLSVGDDVAAVARTGLARFKIVGIVTTDRGDLPAGSSLALFSTDEARKLFGMADNDNRVAIRLEPGADRAAVENQIRAWLPAGSMVVDGETGALHRQESLTRSFTLIRVLIMGFAGLALVVGMVTVANSLTLLYSERRHSFATFRLVGAKRVQIMGAALTEAAMLAGAASLLGAPLGLLLGALIEIVLGALGTSVPVAGSFVSIPALLTAVAVGSVATVLAALVPAWKACGVPAIEAVVESESGREAPYSQRLANAAIVSVAVGFVTLGFLSIADILPGSTLRVSLLVGLGVLAVSQLPTLLAHAVALGIHVFPEKSGALRRIGARDAIRNRTRTAATTGALMLATAVVVGLAVFLSSFAGSLDADVKGLVSADLVIDSGTFTVGGLPTGLVDEVSKIDGVKAVSGWQVGRVFIGDLPIRLTGMDGDALSEVLTPDWIGKAPKPLSPMGIALSNSAAAELGVKLGSEVPVNFASQATEMMTVEGIYASGKVLLGEAVINRELLTRQVPKSTDIAALVSLKPDSEAARAKVTELAKSFGVKAVLDPSDFVNSRSTLLKGFERVIQWMLLFTLLQALVGVVNTLLLSVGERRREFGLLRAAGASRKQVLRLVLVEGGSFAVVGTVLGLIVGVIGAWFAIRALGQFGITGFTVPIPILIVTALAASTLGVVAAIIPARWAAAVPPLEAVMDSGGETFRPEIVRRAQEWITRRGTAKTKDSVATVPAATIQGATASATPFDTPPPFAPSTYTPPPFNPESLNLEPPNLRGVATPSVSAEPVSSEPTAIPVEPEAVPLSGDVAATIAAAALAASVVDSEASSTGDSQATEAAVWLKPRATGQRAKAAGSEVGAGAGRGTGRASEGPARSDSRSEGKSASGSKRGSGTTPPRRSKRGDKEHVLFAPGGGMPAARQMGGQATQVPAVLRDAMSRLSAQSVRDAAPVLEALVSALDPGEKVGHLIQGWAKGLACVVARTDKRVIIVVNRFPEPLVERLHPTRTGISLYGPPGVDHVSVAIVDGRRLLEVSGVLDRAEAMAMRTDHGERPTRRRGYF